MISVVIYVLMVILLGFIYRVIKCISIRSAKIFIGSLQAVIIFVFIIPIIKSDVIGLDQLSMIFNFEFAWFFFFFLEMKRDLNLIKLYNYLNTSSLNFIFSTDLENISFKIYNHLVDSLTYLETNISTDFTNKNFVTISYRENQVEINVITWGKDKDIPLFENEPKFEVIKESLLRGSSYKIIIDVKEK